MPTCLGSMAQFTFLPACPGSVALSFFPPAWLAWLFLLFLRALLLASEKAQAFKRARSLVDEVTVLGEGNIGNSRFMFSSSVSKHENLFCIPISKTFAVLIFIGSMLPMVQTPHPSATSSTSFICAVPFGHSADLCPVWPHVQQLPW